MKAPVRDRHVQRIRGLTEVSRAITYAASLDEVFRLTVDTAAELVAAEKSLLMTVDDDSLLTVRASRGVDPVLARGIRQPLNESLIGHLAGLFDLESERFLGVPLVVSGAIKGILVVIRPAAIAVVEQEEWLLSALADQAAIALERTRLDEIAQFRELLVGIVSHDLRNPLNTILMGTQLLLMQEGLGERQTDVVRKISSAATRATGLIEQLLDLTRSRLGGGIPIDPKRFDLREACQQVIGEIELTHPDRTLSVESVGDLTGVWDRDRIAQLLGNLVGNAVQHGEPLTPIALRFDGREPDVVIEVANRGTPIPPTTLPHIFDAFRQSRTPQRPGARGLGLGLFIAQQIAHSHGGSIAVTSSERDGTTLRVRLPRVSHAAT